MSDRAALEAYLEATEIQIEEHEQQLESLRRCVRTVERFLAADDQ
jgi:hypothetical protein